MRNVIHPERSTLLCLPLESRLNPRGLQRNQSARSSQLVGVHLEASQPASQHETQIINRQVIYISERQRVTSLLLRSDSIYVGTALYGH